ncbi:MAG: cupin domain-containing protein [Planctomycetota bacterium]|nr:cupin domain-containing protein [Planctomycetota bacterium]
MTDQQPSNAVRKLIDRLDLQPHPEGGWFRETFRSDVILPGDALPEGYDRSVRGGDRCAVTSILFLLPSGGRSRRHRIRSEEIWLHQQGDDVRLLLAAPGRDGTRAPSVEREIILGQGEDASLQAVVPRQWWQSAEALPGGCGYALVACIAAPGFEFADFEIAED